MNITPSALGYYVEFVEASHWDAKKLPSNKPMRDELINNGVPSNLLGMVFSRSPNLHYYDIFKDISPNHFIKEMAKYDIHLNNEIQQFYDNESDRELTQRVQDRCSEYHFDDPNVEIWFSFTKDGLDDELFLHFWSAPYYQATKCMPDEHIGDFIKECKGVDHPIFDNEVSENYFEVTTSKKKIIKDMEKFGFIYKPKLDE